MGLRPPLQPMTTDFEQQLTQMIPAIRQPVARQRKPRTYTVAKIAVGFLLGVFVTYNFMQPNESARQPERQETFMLVFDDSNLDQLRRPADVFQSIVRVPVPKVEIAVPNWESDQTQWQYGTLRNELRRM